MMMHELCVGNAFSVDLVFFYITYIAYLYIIMYIIM